MTIKSIRIGKITLDGYNNYGNLLQSYALQQVLLEYGTIVETIWYETDNFIPRTYCRGIGKKIAKYILDWNGFRADFKSAHWGRELVRQAKIKDWSDRYINIRYGISNIATISDKYDYFVVGSDQVWNPYFGDLKTTFLSFAESGKRVAYAASIACPQIPENKKKIYKDGFEGMDFISMREHEGAEIVKRFTGKDVSVVVDPTLLLSQDEWREVSRAPAWYHGEKYILTYFIGPMPDVVHRIANETGLVLINLLDENVYEHYVTGVDEFLWAIEHASLVYTDSFHGTVFSIIFRRPFVVCDRVPRGSKDKVSGQMSSRIDTLLDLFGLNDRRASRENDYYINNSLDMIYPNLDPIFEREYRRSHQYLKRALGEMI